MSENLDSRIDPNIANVYIDSLQKSIKHHKNDIKTISKPINKKYWGQITFIGFVVAFNILANKGYLGNIDLVVFVGTIGIDLSSATYTGKDIWEVFQAKGRDIRRLKRTTSLLLAKIKHIPNQTYRSIPRLNKQIRLMFECLVPIDTLNIEDKKFSDIIKTSVECCANIARKPRTDSTFNP